MEIQKHLYRIAERGLKSPNAMMYWKIILAVCFFLFIYFSMTFVFGIYYVMPNNNQLSQCFLSSGINESLSGIKIQQDAIYMVFSKGLEESKIKQAKQNNLTIFENYYCTIIKNLHYQSFSQKPFEFTWTPNVLYFQSEERELFKFNNYTIAFKSIPKIRYFIYGMDNLLTNELLSNYQQIFPSNPFIKSSTIIISSQVPNQLQLKEKIYQMLKSFIYYMVVSIVTSLYIYGTIIAAPAVIIIFLRCSQFGRNGGNMSEVYKIFPWIGMHSLVRQTSQNAQIKNSARQICKAIILYFFFLYFVYYAIIIQLSSTIFYQKCQMGLQQMLFGYVALIQFCAIVFMRTRPFLKYFPATHTLLIYIFLLYAQFSTFGLKKNALLIACTASASLFAYMILQLQIPGQTVWDRTKKYTPTADRPRIGFLPLFNLSWINNLPDEWTLMFPLFGRQNFSQRELSYVDRNFEELNGIFNVNNNNNQENAGNVAIQN